VTKGLLQTGDPATLTIRAKHLIDSIRSHYTGTPVMPPPAEVPVGAKSS
jgi:hypothetical protein